jgi:regulator of cell morphogenesis and NO signaling
MAEGMITGDMIINEVIARYPWTLPVFHRFSVDSCCGGAQTVAFAAQSQGLDVDELIGELEAAAQEPEE